MAHRILIVEDNPVDQRLFEQALSEPGREIEVCSDGREALAAFERRASDLVVSDIMMPNMEGLELLSELHRRVPGLPVILVTRFGNIPAAVAAMRDGAFDYVTKPVEVFELQTRSSCTRMTLCARNSPGASAPTRWSPKASRAAN